MTVSYTGDVANGSTFGCFWKILIRWKGSVYKLVWRELFVYLAIYFAINFAYRFGMTQNQRSYFEKVSVYFGRHIDSIPMSFVLGFYVSLIVKRWWDQYWVLPMPDSVALYISASIHGQDERARIMRRTIMRYTMLSFIIMLQRISVRVKKRFPTLQHLVDVGIMMESEMKIFESLEAKTPVSKFWLPVIWASNLVVRARAEGRITSDHMLQTILIELSEFRRKLGLVGYFDTLSVPLVYTQVVTLAVHTYFMAALIGRQWVDPVDQEIRKLLYPGHALDLIFPIFLSLQFVFYLGWLKVAETLINPFGEDDDDYELNWLIDRHIQVSYMVVDEIHDDHPELLKDQYWDQVVPSQLPYNLASNQYRRMEPQGSTATMKIKENESIYGNLTTPRKQSLIPEDVYGVYEGIDIGSSQADDRKNWIQRQISRVGSFRSGSSAHNMFHRNRSQLNANRRIALPVNLNQKATTEGRSPSIYRRFINRQSSKDQIRTQSQNPQSQLSTKDTMINMESTTNATTEFMELKEISSIPKIFLNNNDNSENPLNNQDTNYGFVSPNVRTYTGRSGIPVPVPNPAVGSPDNQRSSRRPFKSPPPPYEAQAVKPSLVKQLSQVEENDSWPDSTSSTNRNTQNFVHNYPSKTKASTIFGNTKSSPLLKSELPATPSPSSENVNNNIDSDSEDHYMTIDELGGKSNPGRRKLNSTKRLTQQMRFLNRNLSIGDDLFEEDNKDTMILIPNNENYGCDTNTKENIFDQIFEPEIEFPENDKGNPPNIDSENIESPGQMNTNISFELDNQNITDHNQQETTTKLDPRNYKILEELEKVNPLCFEIFV